MNYTELPINRPLSLVHSYNRDGAMRYVNPADPVYAPNSVAGPAADPLRFGESHKMLVSGQLVRAPYDRHPEDDDFVQPGTLYRSVLTDPERQNLVSNIVGHAAVIGDEMQTLVIEYWRLVDGDLGARAAKGLADRR